jgi:hypothetical protein
MGVGQYDLLKNVQPTDNTVLNTLTVNKLTTLDDTQLVGDIVSHTYICTYTVDKNLALIATASAGLNLPDTGIPASAYCDVDVYELVYMGRDPRAGDNLVQMSASLLIPKTISRNYVSSYKHGYFPYNNPSYTLREGLRLYQSGEITALQVVLLNMPVVGWIASTLGSVTVVSDMIGWGVTRGATVAADKDANVQSEVGAIVATRRLMLLNPDDIFDQFYTLANPVSSVDVILTGYSMGALSGPSRAAELINYQPEYKINVLLLKADGMIPPQTCFYLSSGIYYPIKSTTTSFIPNAVFIPLGIMFLPILAGGSAWDTAFGGILDTVYKQVVINFITGRNTLYNDNDLPLAGAIDGGIFLYNFAYYILNYLEYSDPADINTLIAPWFGYPVVQPSLDPANPGYIATLPMNPYYIIKRDAQKYLQVAANINDFTGIANVPNVNLGGVPIVCMSSNLDENCTVPYANTAGGLVVLPTTVPEVFKSYCTGSVIANNRNTMYSGFLPDPSNPGFYLPDSAHGSIWYQNNPLNYTTEGITPNPHYQEVVVPTTIDRDVSKYTEDLSTTVNTTQACNDIADAIVASIGTDDCKLYMGNTTGLTYRTHVLFSVYTSLCIDSLIVYKYNPTSA